MAAGAAKFNLSHILHHLGLQFKYPEAVEENEEDGERDDSAEREDE